VKMKNQKLNDLRSLVKELVLQENSSRLLIEAAFTPENMPDDELYIELDISENGFHVFLLKGSRKNRVGYVTALRSEVGEFGECSGAFVSTHTWSGIKGMGPLLYDVAIDIASELGGGLASDRYEVSKDALSVWRYISKNRPDIQKKQLDNLDNELTPDDDDNCDMDSALENDPDVQSGKIHWKNSPLSKVAYRPGLQIIKRLIKAGRLKLDGNSRMYLNL